MSSLENTKELTGQRFESLDFIRGIAIALMLIYHFCFGLSYTDIIDLNFTSNLFWISFRFLIIFLFLTLVGVGLVLANQKKLFFRSYLKRLALLLIYSSLISWLSYQVIPEKYIFFGILHLIFVCSILGIFFLRLFWLNLIISVTILLVGNILSAAVFDQPMLQWLGLMTFKPTTNDYTPLFPWFGLVVFGIFIGRWLLSNGWFHEQTWQASHWFNKLLVWAGRYSIHIYFIHFQMFYILTYFSTHYH